MGNLSVQMVSTATERGKIEGLQSLLNVQGWFLVSVKD